MNFHATLQLQATLLLFLGSVVLLAHQTSRSPGACAGARWFFTASLCGAAGLGLQAERGHWPELFSVVLGNFLFLLLTVCMTQAIALILQQKTRLIPAMLVLSILTAAILAYFTFAHRDATSRVLVASIALPVLLAPSVRLLLRCRQKAIRAATLTLAGIMLFFIAGCVMGIFSIALGAHPRTGANWTGAILIAGTALCFLWMDLLRTRAELEQQAMTDPLTGLFNRRSMEQFAAAELARSARKQATVSLLVVDIDHFKRLNDTHGHLLGDSVLQNVAAILKSSVRIHDLVARHGGDEFVILLTESSEATAETIIGRIQKQIAALSLRDRNGAIAPVALTIGRFTTPVAIGASFQDLLHFSDIDLYVQKQARHVPLSPANAELKAWKAGNKAKPAPIP